MSPTNNNNNNNNTRVGIVAVPSYSTTYGVPTFLILFLCLFINFFPPPIARRRRTLHTDVVAAILPLTDIRRDGPIGEVNGCGGGREKKNAL